MDNICQNFLSNRTRIVLLTFAIGLAPSVLRAAPPKFRPDSVSRRYFLRTGGQIAAIVAGARVLRASAQEPPGPRQPAAAAEWKGWSPQQSPTWHAAKPVVEPYPVVLDANIKRHLLGLSEVKTVSWLSSREETERKAQEHIDALRQVDAIRPSLGHLLSNDDWFCFADSISGQQLLQSKLALQYRRTHRQRNAAIIGNDIGRIFGEPKKNIARWTAEDERAVAEEMETRIGRSLWRRIEWHQSNVFGARLSVGTLLAKEYLKKDDFTNSDPQFDLAHEKIARPYIQEVYLPGQFHTVSSSDADPWMWWLTHEITQRSKNVMMSDRRIIGAAFAYSRDQLLAK